VFLIKNDFNPPTIFISAISIWSSSLLKILLMPHPIAVTPADTLSNEDELSHVSNISGLDEEDTARDTADEGIPASRAALSNRGTKSNAKSEIWKYFEVFKERKFAHQFSHLAFCKLCNGDINYTISMSIGMLTRHMRVRHMSDYEE